MSVDLVGLAVLMAAVTYPSRALPLLLPGFDALPPRVLEYLRLVGPAVLAALAASAVLVVRDAAGQPALSVGLELAAVATAVVLVRWRHNLLLALLVAVAVVALARAIGAG
ncbi:MAG: AzlD domain-containing protein [Chloroflexi bacterium]|jgi:branched-subunit amino acid transport protein|nr:AzlD domain-containing protein [Chloroflexota bacterium]